MLHAKNTLDYRTFALPSTILHHIYKVESSHPRSPISTHAGILIIHSSFRTFLGTGRRATGSKAAVGKTAHNRTVLEAHAVTRCQGTVLAIEDLTGGTLRGLNSHTFLRLLVEGGARLARRRLLSYTLLAVELHSSGTSRFLGMGTVLPIKDKSLGTVGYVTNTFLTVESGSWGTLWLTVGDTFAIDQGVAGLTFHGN